MKDTEAELRKCCDRQWNSLEQLRDTIRKQAILITNLTGQANKTKKLQADLYTCVTAIQAHNNKPWYKRLMRI